MAPTHDVYDSIRGGSMDVKRKAMRAGAVLAVALAAGQLVQSMKHGVPGASINAATSGSIERTIKAPAEVPLVPASASLTTGFGASVDEVTELAALAGTAAPDGCAAKITLEVEPDAIINAAISTPCAKGERLVIRHAGMSFAARTSADGMLRVRLPALETEAIVSVFLPDSEVLVGSVYVPEVANLQRFGLQWTDSDVFDLRIMEDDKIFVGGRSNSGRGGGTKIMALGDQSVDQPMFAEIYTYPANPAASVEVVVELAITSETCGRVIQADSILAEYGTVTVEARKVQLPDCGQAGDILVLKNLSPDVKIAVSN